MRSDVQQTLSALANSSSNINVSIRRSSSSRTEKTNPSQHLEQAADERPHHHALHALGGESPSRSTVAEDANQLAALLINGVAITPTESVNVVSETAKMPVTISNSHPYPVKVKVSSLTDSMQIVTSRFDTVQVPPHGEAQVAFTIRVSTSGTANATISCSTGMVQRLEPRRSPTSPARCRSATRAVSSSSASPCSWALWDCGVNSTVKKDPDE